MLHELLLIVGMVVWFSTIAIEYCKHFRFFDNHQIPAPCMMEREFTTHNLLFVAFPVALILVAEMHFCNAIGAMGFTCMVETFCILGITAYEKYERMHPPFCILAGIAHTLNCFNFSILCGAVAGGPLATLAAAAVFCHIMYCPNEDAWHPNTHTSVIFWLMDTWYIFGRATLLFVKDSADSTDDHLWFDAVGAAVLTAVLIITALRYTT